MAFSAADLTAIDLAITTAIVQGVASVTVAGQTVTSISLDELRRMRADIKSEMAIDNTLGSGGIRTRQLIPPGCG